MAKVKRMRRKRSARFHAHGGTPLSQTFSHPTCKS
jgi:hypothetical protein